MIQTRSLFGPLLLIGMGVIWLLVKFGSVPTANLWALTHIWPYMLIAAGAGLLLRSYWASTSILLDILIIGGVFLAILYAPQLGWASPSVVSIMEDDNFYIGPGEPGSGNVSSQTREVKPFDSIQVDFPAEVTVSQGEAETVKIQAEDNVLPGLKTEVRNDRLRIFYTRQDGQHVNPTRAVKIIIVVKDLQKVDFNGAGELTLQGIETEALHINVSGAGNLKLSDIAIQNLSVNLSGAGSMNASGVADDLNIEISGFGSFNGKDLHSQKATITLSGAGSAMVWVDDELDTEISGAGSVNYYGTADVTKQVSGVGSVKHMGDK